MPVAFENDLGMRFVLIPAGTFVMGSPEDEEGRDDDERQREVTLTKPYYMQIREVSVGQYVHFRPYYREMWIERLRTHGWDGELDALPAFGHTSADAIALADSISDRGNRWLPDRPKGRTYRLPTEAEWEHACRAGTRGPFNTGDAISLEQANYASASEEQEQTLVVVGSFAPNSWGLHDMHGNVSEWCPDQTTEYVGLDWFVTRGGSWARQVIDIRSAARSRAGGHWTGFRLVSPMPQRGK